MKQNGWIHISDIYRLIAGHSDYHGDNILSALTCLSEGKEVKAPIAPIDKEKESEKADDNSGSNNTGGYNSGDYNTGRYNSGNSNSGCENSGNRNSGHFNTGNWNAGNYNMGDWNCGSSNSGSWNCGDWNSGRQNSGDWNCGNGNAGVFNTDMNPKIKMFDKESDWTIQDWHHSRAFAIMNECPSTRPLFIELFMMSKDEKEDHPEYMINRGYTKVIEISTEDRQRWWDDLSEDEKQAVLSLPNFDKDIFHACTGVKV